MQKALNTHEEGLSSQDYKSYSSIKHLRSCTTAQMTCPPHGGILSLTLHEITRGLMAAHENGVLMYVAKKNSLNQVLSGVLIGIVKLVRGRATE